MRKPSTKEPSMDIVRARVKDAGLTLQLLGEKMGYEPGIARQSAFQFLKSDDPRISMLRRFADAMQMELSELTAKPGRSAKK
jgi:hypothetical protein